MKAFMKTSMKLLKSDYIKWSLLVAINGILGFLFAVGMMKTAPPVLGLVAGVISFVFAYVKIDQYLKSKDKVLWRRSLYGGVSISAIVQLWPVTTLIIGAISIDVGKFISGYNINTEEDRNFFSVYLVTIIDGLMLSIFAGIIMLLIRFILEALLKLEKNDS